MVNGVHFGYTLSSEEHPAGTLITNAAAAEEAGFDFLGLSDHFSPWVNKQGQAPFSWSVAAGISQRTTHIALLMEVVCPIMRYHPAIVAQAAATTASLLEGRFSLGIGTGEYLNEHIVGEGWPHIDVRRAMLAEAIAILRKLWHGEQCSFYGNYFTVEEARIYSLPSQLPPLVISGFGPKSVQLAGEAGDGLVTTSPSSHLVRLFEQSGGRGKPKYAQVDVCYGPDKNAARKTAFTHWPQGGLKGQMMNELRLPAYFEQACKLLNETSATEEVVLGDDVDEYQEAVQKYIDAGFDHIYFHQIGPDQAGFLQFYKERLRLALEKG
jgi:coenzyme F420-dependent glucose-6-phosphate dehydrogenase